MKPNEILFEAIGNLNDDLLATMEEGQRHPLRWVALAACLALLMLWLWPGGSDVTPQETGKLQTPCTDGVQLVILERRDYAVLVPQGESVAITDYVAQVQDSYRGPLAEGDTITIRAARSVMDVRQGEVLLAALNWAEEAEVYVPAVEAVGVYTVSGSEAIPLDGSASVSVESVILALGGD